MKKAIFCLVLFAPGIYSIGQAKTDKIHYAAEIIIKPVPVLEISGTDSSFKNALTLNPVFSIVNAKGLGLSYSPGLVKENSGVVIYMHDLTLSFEKYDRKHFDVLIDFSHYFFNKNSKVPATPIQNELYSVLTYKKSWIKPMISFGMGFGKSDDVQNNFVYDLTAAMGISHSFNHEFKHADFYLTPSLKLNAGTNAYFSFMRSSKYISANKDFDKYLNKKSGRDNAMQNFSLNNLEAGLRPSFEINDLTFSLATAIFLPVQQAESKICSYWQLNMKYDF